MSTLPTVTVQYEFLPRDTPAGRYRSDPGFRALVDMMAAFVWNCQYSPAEMRDAAELVASRFENRLDKSPV